MPDRDSSDPDAVGLSVRTVERDWIKVRAYLLAELSKDKPTDRAAT